MWIGSRVMSTPAKSRPTRTISRSAPGIRFFGTPGVRGCWGVGLGGDVDAGKVAADEDDLAQRLVDPLFRHHGDVERHGPDREAAALFDLGLLGAGDDVAGGQLPLVRRGLLQD